MRMCVGLDRVHEAWKYIGLVLCMLAGSATAQTDPLKSEACGLALQDLQQLVAVAAPNKQGDAQKIAVARERAAQLCLGSRTVQRERSGIAYPAEVVAPAATLHSPPHSSPQVPRPPVTSMPLAVPRVPAITTCDPAGCWDSEGHRLNYMGPLLMGPRGPCVAQGSSANCP